MCAYWVQSPRFKRLCNSHSNQTRMESRSMSSVTQPVSRPGRALRGERRQLPADTPLLEAGWQCGVVLTGMGRVTSFLLLTGHTLGQPDLDSSFYLILTRPCEECVKCPITHIRKACLGNLGNMKSHNPEWTGKPTLTLALILTVNIPQAQSKGFKNSVSI